MKIEFDTENDAFIDPDEFSPGGASAEECARILTKIIQQIRNDADDGVIMDINGHRVGKWTW